MIDPLFITLSLAAALAVFAVSGSPVPRRRLHRFARWHDLTVTAGNSPRLESYLAVTRRWRAAGATFGGALYALPGLAQHRLAIGVAFLVAGWFAGALAAEVQLARGAATEPAPTTTPARYLSAPLRRALPGSVAACLLLAAPATAALDGDGPIARPAVWLSTAVLAVVLVWAAGRAVLRRPRPETAPDLAAADDAIRSRSLHVLAAGATTLVLYCVIDELSMLAGPDAELFAMLLVVAGLVALPWLAWRMATAPWRVPAGEGAVAA